MSNIMNEYFDALERLKNGTPNIIKIGSKINNDNVSLEAGRKRGTIKKGRENFEPIIRAICDANEEKNEFKLKYQILQEKYKEDIQKFKKLYYETINRELMLIERLNTLEKLVNQKKLYLPKR